MAKNKLQKTTLKPVQKRNLAEQLFMSGMSQVEIAEYLETSTTQISRWKLAGKWEDLRKAKNASVPKLLVNTYDAIQAIYTKAEEDGNRTLTPAETDQIHKLAKTIESLSDEVNVQNARLVLEAYNKFLYAHNELDLVKQQSELQREFVMNLIPVE